MGIVNREEWFHNDQRPTDSYKGPAFQITPVGVSYGDQVKVFGEFGFGMLGLLNGAS